MTDLVSVEAVRKAIAAVVWPLTTHPDPQRAIGASLAYNTVLGAELRCILPEGHPDEGEHARLRAALVEISQLAGNHFSKTIALGALGCAIESTEGLI